MSKITLAEQASNPPQPASGKVTLFSKGKLLSTIDDAGAIQSVGADANAVHVNVGGEIDGITPKTTPVGADLVIIEDSADSFAKKKMSLSDFSANIGDTSAIHKNVSAEISVITEKSSPAIDDVLLYESLVDGFPKRRVAVQDLLRTTVVTGQVDVYVKADFPTPIAGLIFLVPFVVYIIKQPINLGTDRLVGNNITIRGNGSFLAAITSTTTSALLTTNGDGLVIINGVALQNPVGTVLSISLALTGFSVFSAAEAFFTGLGTGGIGTINGALRLTTSTCFFNDNITGLVLDGQIDNVTLTNTLFTSVVGAAAFVGLTIKSTAVIKNTLLTVCQFGTLNASDSGLLVETGASLTDPVRLTSSLHDGPGTYIDPSGVQKSDPDLITFDSPGVDDSIFYSSMFISTNASLTTFPGIGTEVPVGNGTPAHALYVIGTVSERFEIEDGGTPQTQNQELEYNGRNTRNFEIDVDAELDKGGGGSLNIALCVFLNSVLVVDSRQDTLVTNSASLARCSTTISVSPLDLITVCLANDTSTASVTVNFVKIRIRRVI